MRNQKSGGRVGKRFNLPQADACHPQPRLRQTVRSLAATWSLPQSAMKPLACSIAPMEMEKVEVATTAVTLPGPHTRSASSL